MKFGFGILGCGKHVRTAMLPAFGRSSAVEVRAVATTSGESRQWLAESYPQIAALESYEELLDRSDLSGIYIALTNNLHMEWTRRALLRGFSVLCEKPLALRTIDGQELYRLASDRGAVLREAFMYRFHPQHEVVRTLIAEGALGWPLLITGEFHYSLNDPLNPRLRAETGGGALNDAGCYLVDLCLFLTGRTPSSVYATQYRDALTEVDRLTTIELSFGSDMAAMLSASSILPRRNLYSVTGPGGRVTVPAAFIVPAGKKARVELHRPGRAVEKFEFEPFDSYRAEIELFSSLVVGTAPCGGDSFPKDAYGTALLEAAHHSAASGMPVAF